jgi:hypothetical protein
MRMAFDFKEKFDRSGVSSLSATIEIDRSIFPRIRHHYRTIDVAENYRQHLSLIEKRPQRAVYGEPAFRCEV